MKRRPPLCFTLSKFGEQLKISSCGYLFIGDRDLSLVEEILCAEVIGVARITGWFMFASGTELFIGAGRSSAAGGTGRPCFTGGGIVEVAKSGCDGIWLVIVFEGGSMDCR